MSRRCLDPLSVRNSKARHIQSNFIRITSHQSFDSDCQINTALAKSRKKQKRIKQNKANA